MNSREQCVIFWEKRERRGAKSIVMLISPSELQLNQKTICLPLFSQIYSEKYYENHNFLSISYSISQIYPVKSWEKWQYWLQRHLFIWSVSEHLHLCKYMMFYDVLWWMVIYCDLWCSMMFSDVLWCSMMFYDVLWCSKIFYDFLWFSMIF